MQLQITPNGLKDLNYWIRTDRKKAIKIISLLEDPVIQPVLNFPGVKELLDVNSIEDAQLKQALAARCP